jgi:hypothetical protein
MFGLWGERADIRFSWDLGKKEFDEDPPCTHPRCRAFFAQSERAKLDLYQELPQKWQQKCSKVTVILNDVG